MSILLMYGQKKQSSVIHMNVNTTPRVSYVYSLLVTLFFNMWQGAGIEPANILRHCATSWKVVGSIPNSVVGIFPSSRTIALGLTHRLTEMSYQEYFLWDESSQCVGLTTLPLLCANCFKIWDPQSPGTHRARHGLCRDCITFTIMNMYLTIYNPI
jgi:hypothetical protein